MKLLNRRLRVTTALRAEESPSPPPPSPGTLDSRGAELVGALVRLEAPCVVVDAHFPGFPVVYASPALLTLSGRSGAEVVGLGITGLLIALGTGDLVERLKGLRKEEVAAVQVMVQCSTGRQIPWHAAMVPLAGPGQANATHYLLLPYDTAVGLDLPSPRSDGTSDGSEGSSWCPDTPTSVLKPLPNPRLSRLDRSCSLQRPPRPPNCSLPHHGSLGDDRSPTKQASSVGSSSRNASPVSGPLHAEYAEVRQFRESLASDISVGGLAVLHVLEDLTIAAASDGCRAVFGRSGPELAGLSLSSLLAPGEDSNVWTWGDLPKVTRVRRPNGGLVETLAAVGTAEPLRGRRAAPVTFLATEVLRGAEDRCEAACPEGFGVMQQAVKLAVALRRQFVEYMSHELRQHLAVLQLGATHSLEAAERLMEMVAPQLEAEKIVDGLACTAREMRQAVRAMDTVLEGATCYEATAAGVPCSPAPGKPVDVLRSALESADTMFSEKNLTVSSFVDDILHGVKAEFDASRLHLALLNLLSNAGKFSPPNGQIVVRVEHMAHDFSHVRLKFRVRDSGPGLPHTVAKQLFQPYAHLRHGLTQESGGAGLGLATVRAIAEGYGGAAGAMLPPSGGAEFWFHVRLPLCDNFPPPSVASPAASPIFIPRPPKPRYASPDLERTPSLPSPHSTDSLATVEPPLGHDVLVVDDQALIRKYMQMALCKRGLTVSLAAGGEEVIQRFEAGERWRVILSDFTMGAMDGPSMARTLAGLGCTIPIIGVTANISPADRDTFVKSGAVTVLTKPVKVDLLYECVSRYLLPLDRSA